MKRINVFIYLVSIFLFLFSSINFSLAEVPHIGAIKQVSVGFMHVCVLTTSNKVYCYGQNYNHHLGLGPSSSGGVYLEPQELTTLENIKQISVGGESSCALNMNGDVYCWGDNTSGLIGIDDDVSLNISTPIKLSTISNVSQISVGYLHACAVTKNAELYCWGNNQQGRLGIGNTTSKKIPTKVNLPNVAYVVAGTQNTCAITTNNKLYCWGYNNNGQLGIGTSGNIVKSPLKVSNDNVKQVGIGDSHICYVTSSGDAYCAGNNSQGQLGVGTSDSHDTFVKMNISNVEDIRLCYNSTLMLTASHEVYYAGYNDFGIGGNGQYVTKGIKTPEKVGSLSDIRQIDIDSYKTNGFSLRACAVNENGKLYCWGLEFYGSLGDEFSGSTLEPYPVSSLTNVKQTSVGQYESCAIDENNDLYCWGYNIHGQLGDGTNTSKRIPSKVLENVLNVSIGKYNACAIHTIHEDDTDKNVMSCWGYLASFPANTTTNVPVRAKTNDLTYLTTVKKISVGTNHACAITTDDELFCYGNNQYGQIGNNSTAKANYMTKVSSLSNVTDVTCGNDNTCALTNSGEVYCFGKNDHGQIGDGTTVNKLVPTLINGIGTVTMISTGSDITCVVNTSNEIYCWGDNSLGNIDGNPLGESDYKLQPVKNNLFSDVVTNIRNLMLGKTNTMICLLSNDYELYCIGSSNKGVFHNFSEYNDTPKKLGVTIGDITSFATSGRHICAINDSKELYCWGWNLLGETGENMDYVFTPKEIYDGDGAVPCNTSLCCDNLFVSLIGSSCNNGLSNSCFASGEYACYGTFGNSSVVCNAYTPECCQNASFSTIGTTCYDGVGECRNEGEYYCNGYQINSNVACNAEAGAPIDEICNGLDDDCDGDSDENFKFTNYDLTQSNVGQACTKKTGEIEVNSVMHDVVGVGVVVCENDAESTCNITDSDGDGILDNEDVCPGLDDNATFTYSGIHMEYVGHTYKNKDDMDEDGIINCQDECVDELSGTSFIDKLESLINIKNNECEKTPIAYGDEPIFTPTNTVIPTETQTLEPTNTATFAPTDTVTLEPTNTLTQTVTITATNTITKTFTKTYTATNTNTLTSSPTNTSVSFKTPTLTDTSTPTYTASPTLSVLPTIDIVTPSTELPKPYVFKDKTKNILVVNVPNINHGSINENLANAEAKVKYLIHVRKLKRNGVKDNFYKLGQKILTYRAKNTFKFKHMDKGIYSVRYQVIISRGHKVSKTKWSKRAFLEI